MIGTASIQSTFKPWDSEPSRVSILPECGQRSQEIAEDPPTTMEKQMSQSGNVSLGTSAETPYREDSVAKMYAYKQFLFYIQQSC